MHLFRTEMLFLHPPTPSPSSLSRPRYGHRGARLPRYGRAAARDARRDPPWERARIAVVTEVTDVAPPVDIATPCPAAAFARMQAA